MTPPPFGVMDAVRVSPHCSQEHLRGRVLRVNSWSPGVNPAVYTVYGPATRKCFEVDTPDLETAQCYPDGQTVQITGSSIPGQNTPDWLFGSLCTVIEYDWKDDTYAVWNEEYDASQWVTAADLQPPRPISSAQQKDHVRVRDSYDETDTTGLIPGHIYEVFTREDTWMKFLIYSADNATIWEVDSEHLDLMPRRQSGST